jgi:HAD superfamily hydrolase (TIGR01509 family)
LKDVVRKALQPFPEVVNIAKSLKQKYKLVILSNFTKEWADYLVASYKFNEIFDDMFWSFQKGIKKPTAEAYLQITEKFKVRPEECLLVDDKERNIKGARDAGMKTILYTNAEELRRQLPQIGVEIGG